MPVLTHPPYSVFYFIFLNSGSTPECYLLTLADACRPVLPLPSCSTTWSLSSWSMLRPLPHLHLNKGRGAVGQRESMESPMVSGAPGIQTSSVHGPQPHLESRVGRRDHLSLEFSLLWSSVILQIRTYDSHTLPSAFQLHTCESLCFRLVTDRSKLLIYSYQYISSTQ